MTDSCLSEDEPLVPSPIGALPSRTSVLVIKYGKGLLCVTVLFILVVLVSQALVSHASRDASMTANSETVNLEFADSRRVYVDLGANWGNTMRLYEDIVKKEPDGAPWEIYALEIYAFEASPFIQPYLEEFTKFLNDEGPRPPLTVPPSGSSSHLQKFASRYGCPAYAADDAMRSCMFRVFRKPLHELRPDPGLKEPSLIASRLDEAQHPPTGKIRFTSVPAAAGAQDGNLTLSFMTPEQMIRGGAWSRKVQGVPTETVPMVDIVSWLLRSFQQRDFVVVKMDIEGAEFPILDSLFDSNNGCLIDVLAMECHSWAGNCDRLLGRVRQNSCIELMLEGQGYTGWDHHSAPDKYYPIDPRTER